jgi:hypothetical protein
VAVGGGETLIIYYYDYISQSINQSININITQRQTAAIAIGTGVVYTTG